MSESNPRSMNVSLPAEMRRWVEKRIREGGYGSTSEYVRELIRRDRKQMNEGELERALLEGLRSGSAGELTSEEFENVRRKVAHRAKRRRSA